MSAETQFQKAILDALSKAAAEFDEEGVVVTHFVVVAELLASDGEYFLVAATDADSRPWLQDGMIAYAQANGLFDDDYEDTEESDDEEFDD